MAKLFITGDTHQGIDIKKLSSRLFPVGKDLTKDDILVILGDAGFVWDGARATKGEEKYWRDWISDKPWTTLCVLGNHENYDAIAELPDVKFHGQPVKKVTDSLFYLNTGEIYTFCDKTFLVVNGADSHDIGLRQEGISWWREEQIKQDDITKALISLAQFGDSVDYFFSHTGGIEVCATLGFKPTVSDFWLDHIFNTINPDCGYKHYCGHYHLDKTINERSRVVYDDVILLHDTEDDLWDGSVANLNPHVHFGGERIIEER